MPFVEAEVGPLTVVSHACNPETVQRELKALDRGLFLDKEWEPNGPHGGYAYYVVKHRVGERLVLPVAGTEWRDLNGPWPLSLAIVERVKRNENAIEGAAKWAVDRNQAIRESARLSMHEQWDEITRDFHKHRLGNFTTLHRSQGLRIARSRKRSRS
jgi:hypothetical protein